MQQLVAFGPNTISPGSAPVRSARGPPGVGDHPVGLLARRERAVGVAETAPVPRRDGVDHGVGDLGSAGASAKTNGRPSSSERASAGNAERSRWTSNTAVGSRIRAWSDKLRRRDPNPGRAPGRAIRGRAASRTSPGRRVDRRTGSGRGPARPSAGTSASAAENSPCATACSSSSSSFHLADPSSSTSRSSAWSTVSNPIEVRSSGAWRFTYQTGRPLPPSSGGRRRGCPARRTEERLRAASTDLQPPRTVGEPKRDRPDRSGARTPRHPGGAASSGRIVLHHDRGAGFERGPAKPRGSRSDLRGGTRRASCEGYRPIAGGLRGIVAAVGASHDTRTDEPAPPEASGLVRPRLTGKVPPTGSVGSRGCCSGSGSASS